MRVENKIVSYLTKYGNTRESDLISFGISMFGLSYDNMKKVIDRMAVKSKVYRIVHDKLEPPEVYISLSESVPPEVLRSLFESEVSENAEKDAAAILKEASAIAEKRIREKDFEDSGGNSERK